MVVPKFHYRDIVQFQHNDKDYYGKVEIIDEFGTWGSNSNVPSYDIFSEKNNCLFKHFEEPNLKLIAKANTITEKAFWVAEQAHANQIDLGGVDYIWHLIRVSQKLREITSNKNIIASALLHDILEDTKKTENDLLFQFPKEIVETVKCLTREDHESYKEYLKRLKINETSRIIKLCDLTDNMNITRIKNPTKRDYDRVEKYQKAALFLQEKH